jgi:hypothetical protein
MDHPKLSNLTVSELQTYADRLQASWQKGHEFGDEQVKRAFANRLQQVIREMENRKH